MSADQALLTQAPNLFILGAAKAGTTTLYEVLGKHPDIYVPTVKEPQYFSNDQLYGMGLEAYLKRHYQNSKSCRYRIDATPHYIYYEKAAARIKRDLGDSLKFILIMREPVDRAYSLYWNMVREGYENLSFEDAINEEYERIITLNLSELGTVRYQYIDSGLYAKQIKAYLKYFHRDQFLFLLQDDLINKPEFVYRKIGEFLGLAGMQNLDLSIKLNKSSMPRSRSFHKFLRSGSLLKKVFGYFLPYRLKYIIVTKLMDLNLKNEKYEPLSDELRERLKVYFSDDIKELEKLTELCLGSWK